MALQIVDHSLIKHKLDSLRRLDRPVKDFRDISK